MSMGKWTISVIRPFFRRAPFLLGDEKLSTGNRRSIDSREWAALEKRKRWELALIKDSNGERFLVEILSWKVDLDIGWIGLNALITNFRRRNYDFSENKRLIFSIWESFFVSIFYFEEMNL